MEIEKKYLVDKSKLPGIYSWIVNTYRICQYYLNDMNDSWLIRARSMDNDFYLTLKSKGLLSREELEYKISQEDFEKTIKLAKTSLKKKRHHLYKDGFLFEIDEYDAHDFITCEVEFQTEEEAKAFVPPSWCIQDITEDPKYKNINLAK